MSLMPPESWIVFFEWSEATYIGTAVRNSIWAFPVIEAVHLTALCVLGGAVLAVDLRLLGFAMTDQPIRTLVGHVRPWLVSGLVVMLTSGVVLFLSEAIKCFYNQSFWVKMAALPFALAFTFLIKNRVAMEELETSAVSRVLGLASITLWFVVAAAGRWIGYS